MAFAGYCRIAKTPALILFKVGVYVFVFAFCFSLYQSRIPTILEQINAQGELRVLSRNGPTTYYEDASGLTGFEYKLAKRFAKGLGVKLKIIEAGEIKNLIEGLSSGAGHMAAAGLTVTDRRKESVLFSLPYMEVTQKLIYRAGAAKPNSMKDLIGKDILVISNSSHSQQLSDMKRRYPGLNWREQEHLEMLDLIEMVHNGKIDYTLVDSNAYELNTNLYPRARVAFDVTDKQEIAWAFPNSADLSLYNRAQEFFAKEQTQKYIATLTDNYYGHTDTIDYSGALLFAERMRERLPKWKEELQIAAEKYELDWQLLAALSYQESHWNPKAKSYTGVRGFMMLTRDTAKSLGVKNRLDPIQSIDGGARYFKQLYDRIPERVADPDRIWFALSAYNMGMGHLEDARILTESLGYNPDQWSDVKKHIKLLSKRQYYKNLKHGYARGWEALDYVENIRNFRTIIAWNEIEQRRLEKLGEGENEIAEKFQSLNPDIARALDNLSTATL